jgi:hypothetical protein
MSEIIAPTLQLKNTKLQLFFKISSWFFGITSIIAGLGALTVSPAGGIFWIAGGLFVLPIITQKYITPKIGNKIIWVAPLVWIILGSIASGSIPKSTESQKMDKKEMTTTSVSTISKVAEAPKSALPPTPEQIAKIEEDKKAQAEKIEAENKLKTELLGKQEEAKKIEIGEIAKRAGEAKDFDTILGNNIVAAEYSKNFFELFKLAVPDSKVITALYTEIYSSDEAEKSLMEGKITKEEYKTKIISVTPKIQINNLSWNSSSAGSQKDLMVAFYNLSKKEFKKGIVRVEGYNGIRKVATAEGDFWSGEVKVKLDE